jgi:DNA-binding NarL/FixJ family response regulator
VRRADDADFATLWEAGRNHLTLAGATDLARSVIFALPEAADDAGATHGEGPGANSMGLTVRQLEVLRLVAGGLTDREIAEQLFLSRRTVSKHVESILGNLGVTSRREAAAAARNRGLV